MLSAADLARLQSSAAKALPDSCQVQRATVASDGMGGQSQTWATVATVDGRIGPAGATPQEQAVAMRLQGRSLWTVHLPAGTDVRDTDRLVILGLTLEVAGVLAPRSWELWRRVLCVEVV